MPPPVTWLQYPAVWPQELTFKEVGCSCTIFLVTWDPIPSSVNAQGSTDHQVLGLDAIDMPPRGGTTLNCTSTTGLQRVRSTAAVGIAVRPLGPGRGFRTHLTPDGGRYDPTGGGICPGTGWQEHWQSPDP